MKNMIPSEFRLDMHNANWCPKIRYTKWVASNASIVTTELFVEAARVDDRVLSFFAAHVVILEMVAEDAKLHHAKCQLAFPHLLKPLLGELLETPTHAGVRLFVFRFLRARGIETAMIGENAVYGLYAHVCWLIGLRATETLNSLCDKLRVFAKLSSA